MNSVTKRDDPTLLSSHSTTSSTAHLAAWWAISDLRQLSQGRRKEARTRLLINDFYVLLNWFNGAGFCFGGFILFQERRGEGLKRKPTKLKNRCMQGQLGRVPFPTELCKQWAQRVTELAVSSKNHLSEAIIVILLCPGFGVINQGRHIVVVHSSCAWEHSHIGAVLTTLLAEIS